MSAVDRLDEIDARAAAAPGGEWFVDGRAVWVDHNPDQPSITSASGLTGVLPIWADGAAELIAHAPADLVALVAALRAVLALHSDAGESQGFKPGGYGYIEHCCATCGSFGEYGEPYPCPTVVAITAALDGAA